MLCSLHHRSALEHHQHQQQQVAIHTTYPLMRAAKLLEAMHQLNLSPTAASLKHSSRPWPCYEPATSQTATADQQVLLKLPAGMTAEEQAAAAASASAWVAEMARSQELIASLLLRAQKAEMGLSAATLAADGPGLQHRKGEKRGHGHQLWLAICLAEIPCVVCIFVCSSSWFTANRLLIVLSKGVRNR